MTHINDEKWKEHGYVMAHAGQFAMAAIAIAHGNAYDLDGYLDDKQQAELWLERAEAAMNFAWSKVGED